MPVGIERTDGIQTLAQPVRLERLCHALRAAQVVRTHGRRLPRSMDDLQGALKAVGQEEGVTQARVRGFLDVRRAQDLANRDIQMARTSAMA
jgi:hypothetical protein